MNLHHKKALTVALQEIDRNRGSYTTRELQDDMLRTLINVHDLKTSGLASAKDKEPQALTVVQYRKKIEGLVTNHGTALQKGVSRPAQIFRNGSSVVQLKYLRELGYEEPTEDGSRAQAQSQTAATMTEGTRVILNGLAGSKVSLPKPHVPQSIVRDMTSSAVAYQELSSDSSSISSPGSSFAEDGSASRKKRKIDEADDIDGRVHKQPKTSLGPADSIVNSAADFVSVRPSVKRKRQIADDEQDQSSKRLRTAEETDIRPLAQPSTEGNSLLSVANKTTSQPAKVTSREERSLRQSDADVGLNTGTVNATKRTMVNTTDAASAEVTSEKRKTGSQEGSSSIAKEQIPEAVSPSAVGNSSQVKPPPHHTDKYGLTDPLHFFRVRQNQLDAFEYTLGQTTMYTELFAMRMMDENGVGLGQRAEWVANPSREIEKLYRMVFGDDWEKTAVLAGLANDFAAYELVQALVTAEWYRIAFEEKLPWPGPRELTATLEHLEWYFDSNNELASTVPEKLRPNLWKASWDAFQDRKFREEKIRPLAKERAAKFMLILEPQLRALGATKAPAGTPSDEFWQKSIHRLTDIFALAIMNRGLVESSKHPIEPRWIQSGTTIDWKVMRFDYPGREPGIVKFTRSPIVWMRVAGRDEWELLNQAEIMISNRS